MALRLVSCAVPVGRQFYWKEPRQSIHTSLKIAALMRLFVSAYKRINNTAYLRHIAFSLETALLDFSRKKTEQTCMYVGLLYG